MIYLDHASTAWPKAPGVAQAMGEALTLPGSSGRGDGAGARAGARITQDLRHALAGAIHAEDPDRIVLTSGATDSINRAILGVVASASRRGITPHLVTTQIEHNAARRPLLALAADGRVRLTTVPGDADGVIDAESVLTAARDATMVVISWASNVTGAIQPVEELAAALATTPTLLLVDASQTVGLIRSAAPLEGGGIDLLAFSGHKALAGPPGVGALYVGPRAHPGSADRSADLDPALSAPLWPVVRGGTGLDSRAQGMPLDLPHRFEAGTPNVPAYAGLLAAVRAAPSPDAALSSARSLMGRLRERLSPALVSRVRLLGPSACAARVGVQALVVEGFTPEEAASLLEHEFGIIVRAGWHCAPGAAEAMGVVAEHGVVRVSVGHATTPGEIDALADALLALAGA